MISGVELRKRYCYYCERWRRNEYTLISVLSYDQVPKLENF